MKKTNFVRMLAAAAVGLTIASTAAAHFVWIDTETTKNGLLVKSGFGEPDGWDPDLIDKIAGTTYWTRTGAELKKLDLPLDQNEKEYRATVAGAAPDAILAATEYGVIQFGNNPPSLLRYTAKHLLGTPDQWNDETPTKDLRIEAFAKLEGKDVVLKVLFLGQPLPGAKIKVHLAKGENTELTTDEAGIARLPANPDKYGLYVGTTTATPGEKDGKKYDVLKDYATLSFTLP